MSKSTELLKEVLLTDYHGDRARIVHVDGQKEHFDIWVMSRADREGGICTRHRIHSEEMLIEDLEAAVAKGKARDERAQDTD